MAKSLFVAALCSLVGLQVAAQNEDYKSTLSAPIGLNIYNLSSIIKVRFPEVENIPVTFYVSPTYGLNYDYGLNKWLSLGASYTLNYMTLTTDKARIQADTFLKYEGYLKAYTRRHTLSVRCLFHYGNSDKIDMYSGFKVGAGFWSAGISSETDELVFADIFTVDDFLEPLAKSFLDFGAKGSIVLPTAQFIPFGIRGYITENIGIGVELGVGPASFLSGNLNYRF